MLLISVVSTALWWDPIRVSGLPWLFILVFYVECFGGGGYGASPAAT